jgi:hypothetical protein
VGTASCPVVLIPLCQVNLDRGKPLREIIVQIPRNPRAFFFLRR